MRLKHNSVVLIQFKLLIQYNFSCIELIILIQLLKTSINEKYHTMHLQVNKSAKFVIKIGERNQCRSFLNR